MSLPQSIDRQTFLANLRQSGLLTPEQLAEATQRLPDSDRGRVVARAFIEQGLLTKFQAELLLAGKTGGFILGQYRILDQLGHGGMGRVFKAQHRTMGRLVALKVLSPKLLKTGRAQEFFVREVQIAGQLHHPNIVTAYDANHTKGRYYLVLEYVDGPNLDQLVRKEGPLPVGQACDYVRQIASGLDYAARMGMVHRDLKPANVLIQPDGGGQAHGVVKISDFGLARLADPIAQAEGSSGTILTKPNTILGTPDYLSPEQARDIHDADVRSDLYSLGCTLYFLLTARVPFPGGSTLDKLIRHSTEEPKPITRYRKDVPAEVIAIVRKLMAKDPDRRYQTAAELVTVITPFARSGPAPRVRKPSAGASDPAQATPASALSPAGSDAEVITGEEESALVTTLPPGLTPTPMTAARLPAGLRKQQKRQTRVALVWALGIVGGLLALAGALALLW